MQHILMPRDNNNQAIPLLRYKTNGCHNVVINTSTANSTSVASSRIVSIVSTVDCLFETGDVSVVATANSHYLPAGVYLDLALGADFGGRNGFHANISVLAASASGSIYISERD